MKKLFSTGLLSYREKRSDILKLYITNAGMKMLTHYQNNYMSLFKIDYATLNFKNLKIPSDEVDFESSE
ncbi:hypothetical protein IGI37_001698 [Enterococcus sp. AZ194]|uniref:hypothetical protein n=1 Tax=Enterococcus sp. AZ194 TaxID=2774629 RepID=UPI003F1FB6BB